MDDEQLEAVVEKDLGADSELPAATVASAVVVSEPKNNGTAKPKPTLNAAEKEKALARAQRFGLPITSDGAVNTTPKAAKAPAAAVVAAASPAQVKVRVSLSPPSTPCNLNTLGGGSSGLYSLIVCVCVGI